jgi:NAD(P)-dependent dehydrogenase (short-subunit alcohol dehydrogenase family)
LSHQNISQLAVQVMKKQSTGGLILYNLSKQAINPGKNFGPYGLAKSTTLFLMKQYALECGEYNIRVNGINADRIESGLLTKELINQRATSRGLSKERYLSNNLLNKQVLADDVAEAFYAQTLLKKTTANIITVDGGNIEASLR